MDPDPPAEAVNGVATVCRVDYSHLIIRGHGKGAEKRSPGLSAGPDAGTLPGVSIETRYGWDLQAVMDAPVITGALGSTEVERGNWQHVAVGAALAGVTLVCGDDVCGSDPLLRLGGGKILAAPELDRRIRAYRQYHRGRGELLVRVHVEDARLGVAEYLIDHHGLDTIELKWGTAPAPWDGAIRVDSLEWAVELRRRGCLVIPDPSDPGIQAAFRNGAIPHFERHHRLGFVDEKSFLAQCDRLRRLGFRRITLDAGACGPRELALALTWASKAQLDLVSVGPFPVGAGVAARLGRRARVASSIFLHAAAVQCADRLAADGQRVPDLAFVVGDNTEARVFKALALGAPFVKAVGVSWEWMVPCSMGDGEIARLSADLPPTAGQPSVTLPGIGDYSEEVAGMVGRDEMRKIPREAIGVYSSLRSLSTDLRQRMAAAGCLNVASIRRGHLASLTPACAEVTGIPCVVDTYHEAAEAALDA